jgi:hypothetical protein
MLSVSNDFLIFEDGKLGRVGVIAHRWLRSEFLTGQVQLEFWMERCEILNGSSFFICCNNASGPSGAAQSAAVRERLLRATDPRPEGRRI